MFSISPPKELFEFTARIPHANLISCPTERPPIETAAQDTLADDNRSIKLNYAVDPLTSTTRPIH